MRVSRLFIVEAALLIIGIGSLMGAWKGNANISFALPIQASAVTLTGGATGWSAFIGTIATLFGVIMFFVTLIAAVVQEAGTKR